MSPEAPIHGDAWNRSTSTGYVVHPAYSGPQTFCEVPVCLNQEDLRAGKVDVAICGSRTK